MADIVISENGDQIAMDVNVTQFDKPDYTDKGIIEHIKSFEEWLETFFAEEKPTSKVLRLASLE